MVDTKQPEKASEAYYAGSPIMTDTEFDSAIAELRRNDPDNYFLKRVGSPVPGTLKASHTIPMGSLSNANNEQEFLAWIPGNTDICLSHKLDGSSLELVYQDGSFIQAITRGDGKTGEDVTRNVIKSGNVPLSIHPSITSVRCECLIHKDDWTDHFKGDANPRNSAAGTLRRHDGHNAKYLQFYAFDAILDTYDCSDEIFEASKSESELLELLEEWFYIPGYTYTHNTHDLAEWCQICEKMRDNLKYEIDGVVAKIDDRTRSQAMGGRDGRPKGQIAIKFKPRGGETVLNNVVWQVGHTGSLTPVGEVSPVGVGGTIIRRVTLCNMDEIERLGIAISDRVEVVRAGDVIPKLSRRIGLGNQRQRINYPQTCPECGSKTSKDGARLFCLNDQCPGTSLGRVMTWIKKRNILNLGVGIIKAAMIDRIDQLYYSPIRYQNDKPLDAWASVDIGNGVLGEKRAKKIIEAIEKSRSVSLSEFLGSIGIKGIGRSLCRVLCGGLGLKTIDDVFAVRPEQIESLDGFGHTRAHNFCSWVLEHDEEVFDLASEMNFEDQPDTKGMDGSLSGEVICFTGKSPKPRPEMSQLAESAGASVSSSINAHTTILVIADPESESSKAVKARQMGMRLMSPDEFLTMAGV